ncbi:clathrin light chain-domain-containing protein [Hyaloraphidium curvatum]|nr:clathrin light chain-domain-containing protein [Hyaloraphidium curvatum]
MDTFGDFVEGGSDPTADFLAREKALLGDDAALFDTDAPPSGGAVDDDFGDFGGAGGAEVTVAAAEAAFPAEYSFEAAPTTHVERTPSPLPASPVVGLGSPPSQVRSFSPASPARQQPLPPASPVPTQGTGASQKNYSESEFIAQWREKQQAALEERDRKSAEKHKEILEKAKKDLEAFYRDYNEKKDRMKQQAAKDQGPIAEAQQAAGAGGNVWERILALSETSSAAPATPTSTSAPRVRGSKDTSRMRQILTQLRNDPNAPLANTPPNEPPPTAPGVAVTPGRVWAESFLECIDRDALASIASHQSEISSTLRLAAHHLELHNARSQARHAQAAARFAGHVAALKEVKADLDSVFRKLRLLKMKMRNRHPEAMDYAQEKYPDIEVPDD